MMFSALVMIAAAMSVAGASGLAFETGRRRGVLAAKRPLQARLEEVGRSRDEADQQTKHVQAELHWLRNLGLASHSLSGRPVFHNRVAPRDADELAALARGLTLVDDVVIADAHGWPQSRESSPQSADLSALVPSFQQLTDRLAERGLQVLALDLETSGAQHVHVRALQGRGDGLTLLIKTTSQRVNRSVPDVVAHAASRSDQVGAGAAVSAFAPTTERDAASAAAPALAAVLERELASSALAVALTVDGRTLYSASHDGPNAAARACAGDEVSAFAVAAGHLLRSPVVRIHASVAGAHTLSWAALDSGSSVLTFGRADERAGARLDRLLGSVRRVLGAAGAMAFESAGAA